MTKILMEPELVRDFAVDSYKVLVDIYEQLTELKKKINGLPWEGGNRDSYLEDYNRISNSFDTSLNEGGGLLVRVQKEVDGWIAVDSKHAAEYARDRSTWEKISDRMRDVYDEWRHQKEINEAKAHFNDWWKTLDENGKKEYLKKVYEQLAKQWGMEPAPLNFDAIDGKGNVLGQYTDFYKTIDLDPADLNSRSGYDMINDLAHEARHQYQAQSVRFYEQTGSVPEGVTLDQVQSWKHDFDNYIPSDKNPFGYLFQSIETDARVTGSDYANDYLLSQAGGGGSW